MAYEGAGIRIDNAETSTTSAPTAATDGVPIWPHTAGGGRRVHLVIQKAASSGDRDIQIRVYGYLSQLNTVDDNGKLTAISSSGAWYELFDSGAVAETGDFNRAWLLEGVADYSRLTTVIETNSGSSPTLTTALVFGREEQRQ